MGKINTASAIVLALLLLAGMALLPTGIGWISDWLTNERPGTAPVQSVKLALGDDRTDEPGYMMRKMALECRMTTIPVEPAQASMSEEAVYTAAREAMEAYIDAEMFEWFDYSFFHAEPYLGIDPMDKNNNTVFWGVSFVNEADPYHFLFLHIDDETGKILYLNYTTDKTGGRRYTDRDTREGMMERFSEAFFAPLKLTAEDLSEYQGLLSTSAVEQKHTDEVTGVLYTFEDARYGMIRVSFNINPTGFFVSCSLE